MQDQQPLPQHPDDIAARHQAILEDLQARSRAKLAIANRAKGFEAAQPGDVYHVSTTRGIKARNRRGLRFESTHRNKVEVVDEPEDVVAAKVKAGAYLATPDMMEDLFADDGLFVSLGAEATHADAIARAEAAEARAAAAERELAELKAAARRDAADSNDGTPSRLKAAAKAEAEAKAVAEEPKKK